jgi:hypothetical protein
MQYRTNRKELFNEPSSLPAGKLIIKPPYPFRFVLLLREEEMLIVKLSVQ